MTTFETVKDACMQIMKADEPIEILPETRLSAEAGFDSLRMARLIFMLENTYGITFDPEKTNLETVGDIVSYIETTTGKGKSSI